MIGRFPDPNIAEALQRVPGLSVFRDQGEGRYVLVRGSEPRLTAVSIDGVETPAPDGQFRFVALDVIPSDQFAYMEVNKTLMPDMDADGIGGAINLVTRSATHGGSSEITLGLGRNQLVSDGIRQGSFSWSDRYGPDQELGVRVGGSFHRTDRGTDANEPIYGLVDLGGGPIVVLADFKLRDYLIQRRRMSLTGNFDYEVSERSSLFLRTIYSRFTDWELRRELRYRFDKGTPVSTTAVVGGRVERELKDRYEAQDIYSALLGGEHRISADTRLDFRLSYAYAAEEEPDRRDVTFRLDGVDMGYDISDTDFPVITTDPDAVDIFDETAYGIDELVSENNETTDKALSARIDVSQTRTFGALRGELKSGLKVRSKSKDRRKDIRVYGWAGDHLSLAQVADDFEDDEFLDDRYRFGRSPGPRELEELFAAERDGLFVENGVASRVESDPNNYDASEDTYAAYVQAKTGVGRWLALVGGRFELTDIEYESNEVVFDDDGRYEATNKTRGGNDYGRFYPAAHLRFRLDDRTNLRVAWTNAISKPDCYDLAPYSVVNRNDEEVLRGNPDLDATTARNFDALAERYLSSVGIVSVAVFRKNLEDYIYRRTFDEAAGPFAGYEVTQPVNGGSATLTGMELTWQQQFTFLPGWLNGFGVYANYTLTDSEADLRGRTGSIRLPGQAETVTNAALSYQKHGLSARLALNRHDEALQSIGESEFRDVWVDGRHQVDLSVDYRVRPEFRLFAEFANLTDQPFRAYLGRSDFPLLQEFYSWWWNVGLVVEL